MLQYSCCCVLCCPCVGLLPPDVAVGSGDGQQFESSRDTPAVCMVYLFTCGVGFDVHGRSRVPVSPLRRSPMYFATWATRGESCER